ncbi:MAG: ketopantoate reductase family protein [Pontibacterium sp.]
MRIAIWGAGGIGCYYGAKLIEAGHDVVMIARGAHLKAMQQNGLKLSHPNFEFKAPVEAIDQATWKTNYQCQQFDLIIIALKSTATADALSSMKEWLVTGNCPLLSLQNGVDNEETIAQFVGTERTLGGLAVKIGAHILEPGVVEATGVAHIIFGQWPTADAALSLGFAPSINELLANANILTTMSPDIRKELWRKLLINNGVNPLSALTGLNTKQLTSHPVLRKTVYKLMLEAAQAAKSEGVALMPDDIDDMFDLISQFDAIKTSMLVDFEKGRPLERSAICGAVIRRCEVRGIPAPQTELIDALLAVKCEEATTPPAP